LRPLQSGRVIKAGSEGWMRVGEGSAWSVDEGGRGGKECNVLSAYSAEREKKEDDGIPTGN